MTYREYINNMKKEWNGRKVMYQGQEYTVIDVDYNGALLINKKSQFNDTTAIDQFMLDK